MKRPSSSAKPIRAFFTPASVVATTGPLPPNAIDFQEFSRLQTEEFARIHSEILERIEQLFIDYGVTRTGDEVLDLRNLVTRMAEGRFRIIKVPFERKPSNPLALRTLLADAAAVNLERVEKRRCPYPDPQVAKKLITEEPFKERWKGMDTKTLCNWLTMARARFRSSSSRKNKRKRA